MNLYKLTRKTNGGYDTYHGAIVAAESADKAKCIHPDGETFYNIELEQWGKIRYPNYGDDELVYSNFTERFLPNMWHDREVWPTDFNNIECELIGIATSNVKPGIVFSSFLNG